MIEESRARLQSPVEQDPRQRSLMGGALFLLLLALGIVLWHDRQFWFPQDQDAALEAEQSSPAANSGAAQPPSSMAQQKKTAKAKHSAATQSSPSTKTSASASANSNSASPNEQQTPAAEANQSAGEQGPPGAVIGARTVLPPLEVEVVAGDRHRTVRPGSNAIHVELQPDVPTSAGAPATAAPANSKSAASQSAAAVTSEAAERVEMSDSTAANVAAPVRPDYPLLARQMKVEGSVILQALIGRDGEIQNLHVVKGPHILAAAAENAVRQWHFKPHFEGGEAVETQAKITVNFTISTN